MLGALTAIAPLATDMYVPGLPQMTAALHTDSGMVQLTVTAVLLGMVVGQLLFGPISDRLGRRNLLIIGTAGFAVFSAVCAIAPTIELLLAARFLEGLAGAAGLVLARTVISDLFHGHDVPRYFAVLSQILGVAPVMAPLIGAAVLQFADWRSIFVVLAVIGALVMLGTIWRVPESLPPERRHPDGIGGAFRTMGRLLVHGRFIGITLVLGMASLALFAYVSGSAFVFENVHGLSSTQYSLLFAVNAIGMMFGGWLCERLARRFGTHVLVLWSTLVSCFGGVLQLMLALFAGDSLAGSWVALFIVCAGMGMLIPAALSAGHVLGHASPGAASAVLGGAQFLLGALAAPLLAVIPGSGSVPMAALMCAALLLAAVAAVVLARSSAGTRAHA